MDRAKCAILASVFAAAMSGGGQAQTGDLQSELAHCLSFSGAVERLSCYDRLARGAGGSAPRNSSTPPAPLPPRADAASTGPLVQNLGKEELPGARTPPQENRMTAEISEFRKDQAGLFTVALRNGQVWQQVAGDTARVPYQIRERQTVTITRGVLGSYDLTFDGRNMVFKVKRLR